MFRKFATTVILDAQMGEDIDPMRRQAHRAVFNYTPRPGYLYVRSRAISSRCNDNYDMFPAEEIEKSYLSFIGKPVFINHNNENHHRARGVIIDAALHRDRNPDGSPDTWAEVLHEIDAITFPHLAQAILAKEVNRTSMGCDVQISKCSVCGNKATSPLEYCAHIPEKKGKRIVQAGSGEVGKREAVLCYEECYGLSFFENSLLVEQPADPTAYFLGEVEYGPGLESIAGMSKTAAANNEYDAHEELGKKHEWARMDPDEANQFHIFNLHQDGPGPRPTYRNFEHLVENHENEHGELDPMGEREYLAHQDHYDREPEKSYGEFNPEHWLAPSDHPHNQPGQAPSRGSERTFVPFQSPYPFHSLNSRTAAFHPASPTALNEAAFVHETNETDGNDSGFTPDWERKGINVHDYPQAVRELQSNWNIHDDNLADEYSDNKRRDSLKRREVGKLINSLRNHPNMRQSSVIWNLIREAHRIGDDLDNDLRENDPQYWARLADKQPPTRHWQRRAQLNEADDAPLAPVKPPKFKNLSKEDRDAFVEKGKAHVRGWEKRNPLDHQNIVDHWNHATPEEKQSGMDWYSDAHHTAKIIAKGTNTPLHAMAGLVSNYSPQTHWATNIVTAAKAARLKVGLGGKGNKHGEPVNGSARGIMASESQKRAGELLANAPHDEDEAKAQGSHYTQVLKGRKTQAFASLIHSGGDDHSVVVDRHAYSVARGARASDVAFGLAGLGGKKNYEAVSDMYRKAASHISAQEGQTIHPHQVQAATWLVRQRLNEEGDKGIRAKATRSASNARTAIRQMNQYLGEHHPEASTNMPGTGYAKESRQVRAFGETKAPRDVDTLRAENCTVCGNSSAFDGTQCQVCGYISPPRPFGDPDTDTAKSMDIRKQVLDSADGTADPNDPDQQLGNQVGNPEELDDQAADAQDEGTTAALTCTNCGTGIIPQPPQSEGQEPPYPAEGDVCPVCKKGELLSESDPGEDADEDDVPDAEEDEESPDAGNDPGFPNKKDDSDDDSEEDEDDADERKGKGKTK